jgi:hypothetical protein
MSALTVEANATEVQLTLSATNQLSAAVVDVDASKVTYIEADAGNSVARESVKQALVRIDGAIDTLNGNDTTAGSVAKSVKDAVEALDATADATKTAVDGNTARTKTDADAVQVLQAVVEEDGKLSSMTVVEAAVVGTDNSRTGSGTELDPYVYPDTIKGTKQYADDEIAKAVNAAVEWGTF